MERVVVLMVIRRERACAKGKLKYKITNVLPVGVDLVFDFLVYHLLFHIP